MRALLLALALATSAGCSDDAGPEIVEIMAPDALDDGDSAEVTVVARGAPDTQVSIALGATAGTVSPASMIVLTDATGAATFRTTFTAAETGGDETLTANVSTLDGAAQTKTRAIRVNELVRAGTITALDMMAAQEADILLAYPIALDAPGASERLGVLAPAQPAGAEVTAHVGAYRAVTATSLEALAPVRTVKLQPGRNELAITPAAVPAGTYWFVIQYAGTPVIYRSSTEIVVTRFKRALFDPPPTTMITELLQSAPPTGTGARVYRRNLYFVVRP